MRVLGVPGSLRRDSHNRRLLQAAAATLPPEAKLVIYDGLKAIPPFDEDDEHSPSRAVRDWREAIGDAGALLFATPEYNSSIPGQLKNAIDWASRPIADAALRNKPAAVIGASTGSFWAVEGLRPMRAARWLTLNLPKPASETSPPAASSSEIESIVVSTSCRAWLAGSPLRLAICSASSFLVIALPSRV